MEKRRVVITGMGTVNPLANNVADTWKSLLEGKSGITEITRFDASRLATRIAGEVKNFDYTQFFEGEMLKSAKRIDRFCHLAVAATAEAAEQAGLADIENRDRIGIAVGSGIGGLDTQKENSYALYEKGPRKISPFYIPFSIGNMAAGFISIIHGLTGPNLSVQTACATANHSMGIASMMIRNDMADIIVAGGAESTLNELALGGFGNMRAISTRNDSPETASRPYDVDRDGFVMSEGAGILILEDYEHAKKRGADIICELLACGMSGDAYHFAAPDPAGKGAALAMRNAVKQAEIPVDQIGYVNAHGTSTPLGDIAELKGVYELLNGSEKNTHVGSTKSYHGHLLGAAAGIEGIITALAIKNDTVPANINIFNLDPAAPPLQLPTEIVEKKITAALSNSFGFGGHNSSLVLKKV